MIWQAHPRLGMFASCGGAGKSYLAKLVKMFVPNGTMEDEPTGPSLARMVGVEHSVVFLDEGDILFGSGNRKQMVRSLLNNGYTPEGSNSRMWGNKVYRISTFGAVCVAAIDTMEKGTGDALKPLLERFIKIRLQKAPDGYRTPRIKAEHRKPAEAVAQRVGILMAAAAPELSEAETDMPHYMGSRTAEIWEPLYLTAMRAGGHWIERVVKAADWFENGGEARHKAALEWEQATASLAHLMGKK